MWGQLSTTCSNATEVAQWGTSCSRRQPATDNMAWETVDPIDWSHPPHSWAVPPERLMHCRNRWSLSSTVIRSLLLQHARQPSCLCGHSWSRDEIFRAYERRRYETVTVTKPVTGYEHMQKFIVKFLTKFESSGIRTARVNSIHLSKYTSFLNLSRVGASSDVTERHGIYCAHLVQNDAVIHPRIRISVIPGNLQSHNN